MTLEDLEDRLEDLFPGGFEIEFDDNGRLTVITNLYESGDGELSDIESEADIGSDMDDEENESYDESSEDD